MCSICWVSAICAAPPPWRRALADGGFDVLLVSGGAPVPGLAVGATRFHQLPPLRAADETLKDLSRLDGTPLDEAFAAKRARELLDLLRAEAPDILITEQFPLRPHPAALRAAAAPGGGEGDAPAAADRFLGARCGAPFGFAAAGRGVGEDFRGILQFRTDPCRPPARRIRAELRRLGPHQGARPLYRLCRGARAGAAVSIPRTRCRGRQRRCRRVGGRRRGRLAAPAGCPPGAAENTAGRSDVAPAGRREHAGGGACGARGTAWAPRTKAL